MEKGFALNTKTEKIMKILEELEKLSTEFDITFDVDDLSWEKIGRIIEFCKELLLEPCVYQDTVDNEEKTVIRIRYSK